MSVESAEHQVDSTTAVAERTWDTDTFRADFTTISFLAPFVYVCRKSDGRTGTLEFNHSPRVYYGWTPE